jgi:hypothetical protein
VQTLAELVGPDRAARQVEPADRVLVQVADDAGDVTAIPSNRPIINALRVSWAPAGNGSSSGCATAARTSSILPTPILATP